MKRLVLAVVAWPAGLIAALIREVATSHSGACRAGESCLAAARMISANELAEFLVLALGPGIVATLYWWRGRRRVRQRRSGEPLAK